MVTLKYNLILKCRHCKTVRTYLKGQQIDLELWRSYQNGHCPFCPGYARWNAVKGKTTDHVCDARCMGATGPTCECSCGGANHGINFAGGAA